MKDTRGTLDASACVPLITSRPPCLPMPWVSPPPNLTLPPHPRGSCRPPPLAGGHGEAVPTPGWQCRGIPSPSHTPTPWQRQLRDNSKEARHQSPTQSRPSARPNLPHAARSDSSWHPALPLEATVQGRRSKPSRQMGGSGTRCAWRGGGGCRDLRSPGGKGFSTDTRPGPLSGARV